MHIDRTAYTDDVSTQCYMHIRSLGLELKGVVVWGRTGTRRVVFGFYCIECFGRNYLVKSGFFASVGLDSRVSGNIEGE